MNYPLSAEYNLLLKGGTVIDPGQRLRARRDVAFANGLVAAVAEELDPASAARTIDCTGCIVAPGLIDLHVHVYPGVSHFGVEADDYCLARGTTTAVDTGSAGADTYVGFRRWVVNQSRTRILAFLNISSPGMTTPWVGELQDIRHANVDRCVEMIDANRDNLLGVKVRLTRETIVSASAGFEPMRLAREAADRSGTRLMIHPQEAWCDSMDDELALMRAGDIVTHCYHGDDIGILDENGRVRDAAWAAAERGVLFDVGHGGGSFKWEVAEAAVEQGFLPHTISSDLHFYNFDGPVYDMPTTMSKFLHLGLSLDQAIEKSTSAPARVLGMENRIGGLREGMEGDAVVLRQETGEFPFVDSWKQIRVGRERLVLDTVVKAGAVVGV